MKHSITIKPYMYDYPQQHLVRVSINVINSKGKVETKTVRVSYCSNSQNTHEEALEIANREYATIMESTERKAYLTEFTPGKTITRFQDTRSLHHRKTLPFRGFSVVIKNDTPVLSLHLRKRSIDTNDTWRLRSLATHTVDTAIEELNEERTKIFGMTKLNADEVNVLKRALNAQLAHYRKYGKFDTTMGDRYHSRYLNTLKRKQKTVNLTPIQDYLNYIVPK
jgi:hypothetical protein